MSSFINDERGISEEFTSLPALMIVMVGFSLFFALIVGVYHVHDERMKSIDKYEEANFVLEKLTSSGGILEKEGIIKSGGVIDKTKFAESTDNFESIIKESGIIGIGFGLKLEYEGCGAPLKWTNIPSDKNIVSASKQLPVYINAAQTVPGVLTVMTWGGE